MKSRNIDFKKNYNNLFILSAGFVLALFLIALSIRAGYLKADESKEKDVDYVLTYVNLPLGENTNYGKVIRKCGHYYAVVEGGNGIQSLLLARSGERNTVNFSTFRRGTYFVRVDDAVAIHGPVLSIGRQQVINVSSSDSVRFSSCLDLIG